MCVCMYMCVWNADLPCSNNVWFCRLSSVNEFSPCWIILILKFTCKVFVRTVMFLMNNNPLSIKMKLNKVQGDYLFFQLTRMTMFSLIINSVL